MAFPTTYDLLNFDFLTPILKRQIDSSMPKVDKMSPFLSKTGQTLAFPTTYDILNLVFPTPYLKKTK